jgi:uncharacterized membrane protein (DUF106 family)|eukprot:COSAG06_NODE_10061_length_1759_cov_1.717470_2_plen_279_part_00
MSDDEDDFAAEPEPEKKARKPRRRRASVSNEAMAINEAIKKSKLVAKKRVVKKSKKTVVKKKLKGVVAKISGVLNGPSKDLGRALVALATVEAVIMLAVACVAFFQVTQSSGLDVAFALMGFVSTFIGTSGVTHGNRELLMLYFVLLAWSIARLTNSITNNMVERVRMAALCKSANTEQAEQEDGTEGSCNAQLALLTANITLSIITLLLVVVSAWLAMRDSERIQEEEDEAAAAEKERVKTVMAVMQSRSKSVARRNSKFASNSFNSLRSSSDEGSR